MRVDYYRDDPVEQHILIYELATEARENFDNNGDWTNIDEHFRILSAINKCLSYIFDRNKLNNEDIAVVAMDVSICYEIIVERDVLFRRELGELEYFYQYIQDRIVKLLPEDIRNQDRFQHKEAYWYGE